MLKKFVNDYKIFLITLSFISFFIFFIIFNKYSSLSKDSNLYFILIPFFFLFLSLFIYLLLILNLNINIKSIKYFHKNYLKLSLSVYFLIVLYLLNYIFIDTNQVPHSNLLKFIFGDSELYNFTYRNIIIIFFIFFLINSFIINQLALDDNDAYKIFFNFSLFFLLLSFVNFLFFIFFEINNFYFKYLSDMDNCIYFQFLPFGHSGKRHYEIIPFIIGYAITLKAQNKKIEILNMFFFLSCFLSFSRNIWITLLIINLFYLLSTNLKYFLKKLVLKILVLLLTIFLIDITYKVVKNCEINLKSYTIYKIISLDITQNERINDLKKSHLKKINSMDIYFDKSNWTDNEILEEKEFLLNSTSSRVQIYIESFKKFKEKIFFGFGSNNYLLNSNYSSNPESEILKILLDCGLIGILFWLIFFGNLLVNCKTDWSFYILLSIASLSLFNIYSWFLPIYQLFSLIIFFNLNNPNKLSFFMKNK